MEVNFLRRKDYTLFHYWIDYSAQSESQKEHFLWIKILPSSKKGQKDFFHPHLSHPFSAPTSQRNLSHTVVSELQGPHLALLKL